MENIINKLKNIQGDVSFYYKNLTTNNTVGYN
ncbi:serine hydrolase, partial [Clostridium perfringens]|nr:serine hydrolase [Clostridium perfringens]